MLILLAGIAALWSHSTVKFLLNYIIIFDLM